MAAPHRYILRSNDSESGPFTVAQINRMKQRGEIVADTPCRIEQETEFRPLSVWFPHLKDHQGADPAKLAKIKREIAEGEIKWLIKAGFASCALSWAPFYIRVISAAFALECGAILLVRYQHPLGALILLIGVFGLVP